MPELKRNFTSGRMNKDLDERLIPNGEYRDALNINVSTSTGSDVGSIENAKGNSRISTLGIAGQACIGSVRDEKTNKIYWFITGTSVDAIAEYDVATNTVKPVLVDKTGILNFDSNYLITGANILDGILFFTDNLNEPKQVDIVKGIKGSVDFDTHTKLIVKNKTTTTNIAKEHITVIKKSPLNAPTVTLSSSLRGGVINTTFESSSNFFVDTSGSDNVSKSPGTIISSLLFSPKPNYKVGDIVKFTHTAEIDDEIEIYEVRMLLTVLNSENAISKTFTGKILSITEDVIGTADITWDVELEQKDPLFELAFPRFAYRWRYANGQYSAFSPFSEVAFLPDETGGFEYDAKDGYNLAMTNNVRKITLNTFDTKPDDVTEVDILYKQSNSTNVYTVKSLKNDETSFDVTSEQIHAAVPSNQILRPYDNVPKKAQAQEVVANRLVFGNYTQNYNVPEDSTFEVGVVSSAVADSTPSKSLKSIRKYQLGVVYLDEFGRQTPVFSDDTAVVSIDQIQSNKINKIQAKITSVAPDWATHFKYYIKEISSEYYNLAMDRYYEAEDGNVWLSFPSSERNKVDLETYLILKKKHTEDQSVFSESGGTVKYKILDIANEAPTFLKQKRFSLGKINTQFGTNSNAEDGFPAEGFLSIKVKGDDIGALKDLHTTTVSNKYIRVSSSNNSSNYYRLNSIEVTDQGTTGNLTEDVDTWKFNLVKAFGKDIDFVGSSSDKTAGLSLEVFEEEIDENNPEFVGRFFVKIPRDTKLEDSILSNAVDKNYVIKNSQSIHQIDTTINNRSEYKGTQLYAIDKASGYNVDKSDLAVGVGARKGNKRIDIRLIEIGPDGQEGSLYPNIANLTANADLDAQLRTSGTLLRFKSDVDQEVYKIVSTTPKVVYNYSKTSGDKKDSSNHGIRYSITLDKPLNFSPQDSTTIGETASDGTSTVLEVVRESINEETFSSDSPAIFETEPKPSVDLDLYYETSKTYAISDLAVEKTLDYFNCFSFGNGVESNRIRDDYNASTIDKGVRVSTVLAEQYKEEHKASGLIYSGIYNSTSGINRLNQFIAAEKITKDLNPEYGSIQKLHTRNTDLIALCEDKILKILANKDALFNADGNVNLTSTNNVLGQAIPFAGEYGISKNPESFASYGYRAYFSDKDRAAVLRLSVDGLTVISGYGMGDYFSDNLALSTTIIGSYDEDGGNYNITLNNDTVSFAENINGWESRRSYIPENGISLNNVYYTFNNGDMWKHTEDVERNKYYGASTPAESTITLLLNDAPSSVKNFKTLNYEGSTSRLYNSSGTKTTNGWYVYSIETDQQSGEIKAFKEKEGKWFNYIKGTETTVSNIDAKEFPIQGIGTLSSITDATGQSLYNVNITVNGLDAQNMTLTGVSGPGTWTLSGNTVTRTGVSALDDIEPVVLTFTVDDNYENPISQALASQSPSATFNSVGYNTPTATTNTLTLEFASATLTADKNITITLNSGAVEKTYSISGTFDDTVENVVKDRYYKISVSYTTGNVNPLSTFPGGDDLLVTFYANSTAITGLTDLPFDFDGNTNDSKPGTNLADIEPIGYGEVKMNSTAPLASKIFIDDIDKNHDGIDKLLALHGTAGAATKVRLARAVDTSKFFEFSVSNVELASTTISSSNNNAFSGSATVNNTVSGLISKVFQADEGYIFTSPPQIIFTDVEREDNYGVVISDASDEDGNLTTRRFQVSYDITDKENISGDKINFIARAVNNQTSTNQLYRFTCDQTNIDHYGDQRTVRVYGDENSTYKISVSDGTNTYDFTTDEFTSSSTESGTLTIPAVGYLDTEISFPAVDADKTYTFTLTPLGSSVWNDGDSTKTFTIAQTRRITVNFSLAQLNAVGGSASATPTTYVVKGQSGDTDETFISLSYTITASNTINLISQPVYNSWTVGVTSVNTTTKELTLTNGSKVKILKQLISVNGTTATFTALASVTEFGTDDDTVAISISNHLSAAASSSYVYLGATESDDDLTSASLTSGNVISDAATTASGTGKVVGDFSGNLISDITINVVSITDTSQITAFGLNSSSTTPQSVTPTSLTQISSTVWEATFDWSATINASNTVANNTYNVQLSVDLGGIQ